MNSNADGKDGDCIVHLLCSEASEAAVYDFISLNEIACRIEAVQAQVL